MQENKVLRTEKLLSHQVLWSLHEENYRSLTNATNKGQAILADLQIVQWFTHLFIECLSIWGYIHKDEDNTPRRRYISGSYANIKLLKSWGTRLCSGGALEEDLTSVSCGSYKWEENLISFWIQMWSAYFYCNMRPWLSYVFYCH